MGLLIPGEETASGHSADIQEMEREENENVLMQNMTQWKPPSLNIIVLPDMPFGFDLDDGSTNYHIFNNLCLGVGIKCREGFDRLVENNILVDAPLDVHCQYAYNHDLYRNNLILCSEPVRYAGGAEDKATTGYETNLYLKEGQWKIYGKENSVQENRSRF